LKNICLQVSYDGTHFAGFQRQPRDRTVQGAIEETLVRITGETLESLRLAGAGRTDTGVHASGQVVNFRTAKTLAPERWLGALNALLPPDVAVGAVAEVDGEFHSRFSATSRSYRYVVVNRRTPDPLRRHAAHLETRALPHLEAALSAWRGLTGTFDFVRFCSTGSNDRSTVCTVSEAEAEVVGDEIRFTITAQSFLYHMVRRLVGSVLEVAKGRLTPEAFTAMVRSPEGPQGPVALTAPACGLTLTNVTYPSPIGWQIDSRIL